MLTYSSLEAIHTPPATSTPPFPSPPPLKCMYCWHFMPPPPSPPPQMPPPYAHMSPVQILACLPGGNGLNPASSPPPNRSGQPQNACSAGKKTSLSPSSPAPPPHACTAGNAPHSHIKRPPTPTPQPRPSAMHESACSTPQPPPHRARHVPLLLAIHLPHTGAVIRGPRDVLCRHAGTNHSVTPLLILLTYEMSRPLAPPLPPKCMCCWQGTPCPPCSPHPQMHAMLAQNAHPLPGMLVLLARNVPAVKLPPPPKCMMCWQHTSHLHRCCDQRARDLVVVRQQFGWWERCTAGYGSIKRPELNRVY